MVDASGADGGSSLAPPDPPSRSRRRPWGWLKQWVRHHAASLVATATDFVTMVGVVELAGASPVIATAIGAAAGAVVNFLLGRHWIYEHGNGTIHGQALRYLIVTVASLGLNTGGVYLLAGVLGLHYFPARVITALVVSNGWNYPMQRFFVFAASRRSAA